MSRTTCENCEAYRLNLEEASKQVGDLRTTIRAAESRNEELHRKLANVKYELDLHVEARAARKANASSRKCRSLILIDPPFILCCFW